ncbi:hypothetical protein AVEN_247757-1 [Araneus ventricosus]|uniref:Mos1 transposase HTH domain-containing protein n=1 Tax=Araneus ventricosus TaxID=182803 RepID=A0A4Y2VCI8_ARAVE|nr:hypothetical protein AVEN_247757-1 [Araneus ventricosus]
MIHQEGPKCTTVPGMGCHMQPTAWGMFAVHEEQEANRVAATSHGGSLTYLGEGRKNKTEGKTRKETSYLEQRSWIMIECARGHTARQRHQEACRKSSLPYRTVARWVKAFNEGRQNVADMRRPGRPSVSEEEVYALAALLDSDRRHTIS